MGNINSTKKEKDNSNLPFAIKVVTANKQYGFYLHDYCKKFDIYVMTIFDLKNSVLYDMEGNLNKRLDVISDKVNPTWHSVTNIMTEDEFRKEYDSFSIIKKCHHLLNACEAQKIFNDYLTDNNNVESNNVEAKEVNNVEADNVSSKVGNKNLQVIKLTPNKNSTVNKDLYLRYNMDSDVYDLFICCRTTKQIYYNFGSVENLSFIANASEKGYDVEYLSYIDFNKILSNAMDRLNCGDKRKHYRTAAFIYYTYFCNNGELSSYNRTDRLANAIDISGAINNALNTLQTIYGYNDDVKMSVFSLGVSDYLKKKESTKADESIKNDNLKSESCKDCIERNEYFNEVVGEEILRITNILTYDICSFSTDKPKDLYLLTSLITSNIPNTHGQQSKAFDIVRDHFKKNLNVIITYKMGSPNRNKVAKLCLDFMKNHLEIFQVYENWIGGENNNVVKVIKVDPSYEDQPSLEMQKMFNEVMGNKFGIHVDFQNEKLAEFIVNKRFTL